MGSLREYSSSSEKSRPQDSVIISSPMKSIAGGNMPSMARS